MNDVKAFFHESKNFVDQKLREYVTIDVTLLNGLMESINYTLFSGGKRIRPLFCFLVGELFTVPKEKLATLACALEMIHTSSLIMDDLPHMDDSRLRRGKPANHLVYGQDVASLASIALLTKAYHVVLNDAQLPHDKKTIIVSKLVQTVGINGMVGGQYADLKFLNDTTDLATLELIHTHKTASLFMTAGETAAIVGNATENEIQAIRLFAKHLGFAFQIQDDLLDTIGKTKEVKKSLHNDKANFITLLGIEDSKKMVEEHTNNAIEAIRLFDGRNDKLLALSQILLKRKS